jgi:hypothetical protein
MIKAVYWDDLLAALEREGQPLSWGVIGISVTSSGPDKAELFNQQDCMFSVSFNSKTF